MRFAKFLVAPMMLALLCAGPAQPKNGHDKAEKQYRKEMKRLEKADRGTSGWNRRTDRDRNRSGYYTDRDTRFRGLDRNGDGVVTRYEWRGNNTSFERLDRNRDGFISGADRR